MPWVLRSSVHSPNGVSRIILVFLVNFDRFATTSQNFVYPVVPVLVLFSLVGIAGVGIVTFAVVVLTEERWCRHDINTMHIQFLRKWSMYVLFAVAYIGVKFAPPRSLGPSIITDTLCGCSSRSLVLNSRIVSDTLTAVASLIQIRSTLTSIACWIRTLVSIFRFIQDFIVHHIERSRFVVVYAIQCSNNFFLFFYILIHLLCRLP